MEKQLTYRNLMRQRDGTIAELENLPNKQEIGTLLNETAMKAAGYAASKQEKPMKIF